MFTALKQGVQANLTKFASDEKYVLMTSDVDKDVLWNTYLNNFPEEIRQEYNCNCCRGFIKQFGNIVAITKEGEITSIWSGITTDPRIQNVVVALDNYVLSEKIKSYFLTDTLPWGCDFNFQQKETEVIKWEHFYYKLASTSKLYVKSKAVSVDSLKGSAFTKAQVYARGLKEISLDSAKIVLELIRENNLYRGKEFESSVEEFVRAKKEFDALSSEQQKDCFCFVNALYKSPIRNTVIGTLLVDLSEGTDIEYAVKSYERKVAPANYKRPTSIVTEAMKKQAEQVLNELNLLPSLKRRFATLEDIPVGEVKFIDRSIKTKSLSPLDVLGPEAISVDKFKGLETISWNAFFENILPTVNEVSLLVENKHEGNIVSILTEEIPNSERLFQWSNPFSWAYKDNMADSIKQKVKEAGGDVDGAIRISLSWFNYDDLDLHVIEPGGREIWFRNKTSPITGGTLDVDMNAGSGKTRTPVENITYKQIPQRLEGDYHVLVHNYHKRESVDVGFVVELEINGSISTFEYKEAVRELGRVPVVSFTIKNGEVVSIDEKLLMKEKRLTCKPMNGIQTNTFQKVAAIINSPNAWAEENNFGNIHTFFLIDGLKVQTPVRAFFNEMLRPELQKHRKVFEILGSRLLVEPTEEQLNGVGFSHTQQGEIMLKCNMRNGEKDKIFKVTF